MEFSLNDKKRIARIRNSLIGTDDLVRACANMTSVELVNVKSSAPLSSAIDFSASDSFLGELTLHNDDFEQAELHPNYGRLEHTNVSNLIIGSHVVCDVLDYAKIQNMQVFGEATIRFDATVNLLDVTTVGKVTILGCNINNLDVSGTVIAHHCALGVVNLRPGGRLFLYGTSMQACDSTSRDISTGKIKLDDPFVMNLLAMNEFEYYYG